MRRSGSSLGLSSETPSRDRDSLIPAATRFDAMSTPSTSAPSLACGNAVFPSPHPRSRILRPLVIPRLFANASPLSRMLTALRVKSPFYQSALFGLFIGASFLKKTSMRNPVIFDQDRLDCCIRLRHLAASARPSRRSPRVRPMSFNSRSLS
jgi:hypothetical protein